MHSPEAAGAQGALDGKVAEGVFPLCRACRWRDRAPVGGFVGVIARVQEVLYARNVLLVMRRQGGRLSGGHRSVGGCVGCDGGVLRRRLCVRVGALGRGRRVFGGRGEGVEVLGERRVLRPLFLEESEIRHGSEACSNSSSAGILRPDLWLRGGGRPAAAEEDPPILDASGAACGGDAEGRRDRLTFTGDLMGRMTERLPV